MSYRFDTLAIHSAQPDDETTGAILFQGKIVDPRA